MFSYMNNWIFDVHFIYNFQYEKFLFFDISIYPKTINTKGGR